MSRAQPSEEPPPLEPHHWYYRYGYVALGRLLSRYHRTRVQTNGSSAPAGACIYVAHHGAGYLTLDLVVAGYELAWRAWYERRGPAVPFRIVASRDHKLERALPGLRIAKRQVGLIDPSEPACLAVLERGEQLLITPGGRREARPGARDYRLRWDSRYGFVRLALKTGAPIIPLAVVGGFDAYPGWSWGALDFWSPVPLPARLDIALGTAVTVDRRPDQARDGETVRGIHERVWRATQSLYDELLARRTHGVALAEH
jgi:1-acyl-sn-glycerol-3-phosphate acyltransferase